MRRLHVLVLVVSAAALVAARPAPPPSLRSLRFVGSPALVDVTRDVLDVLWQIDPSLASGAGLPNDALRVPTYDPPAVDKLHRRLTTDLARLRKLPWRTWDVDTQIDTRWLFAQAELADHVLTVEKMYERRPGQWLEPTANNLIALETYWPERPELVTAVLDKVPAMIAEMRRLCVRPTRRDLETGRGLADALEATARAHNHPAAAAALATWRTEAGTLAPADEFDVIGPEAMSWRFEHAMLLPWTPTQLLEKAKSELERVDAAMAAMPKVAAPPATADQSARAAALDQAGVLALYDKIEAENRAATVRGGWVTVPETLGPIQSRPTPPGMIPLTGDGGSMNPPPTYILSNIGWWNVEHFNPAMPAADREGTVVSAENFLENGMGTYSAHEGWPGHHLQLSIARLNPDPIRSILPDCTENEGWALYAEQTFAEHGGLGSGDGAKRTVLGSYRVRIARVFYDVNIESRTWSLQEAADWKYNAAPGEGTVDADVLRSINWPTQLVCYFAGKQQILEMRDAARRKLGEKFDERAFHDALLQAGSIPYALVRAKVLGESVPDFPPLATPTPPE